MSIHRKLVTVAALAFGLAACGGGGSGPTASGPGTPTTPEPAELQVAQKAAADAAMTAETASKAAATAAGNAMTAGENLATMQTGGMSAGLAQEAQHAAEKAMAAYMAAKSASEDAAAATTATAAVMAQVEAEEAQADAEMYSETAVEKGAASETAAAMELMIDGAMKSVGDTMVDANAPMRMVTTTTDGKSATANTGLQEKLKQTSGAVTGAAFANTADSPPNPNTAYAQAVAARALDIGKTVDSGDDTARLMLFTHYAGSRMVNVYALHGTVNGVTSTYDSGPDAVRVGPTDEIFVGNGPDGSPQTADDVYAPLHDAGMFYRVGPNSPDIGDLTDTLDAADQLAANTKPETVYRYTVGGNVRYVIVTETETSFDPGRTRTLITRWHVDITAPAADANDDGTAEQVRVKAALPEATAYNHIHFGVWAGLGDADADGSQAIADMGIGFVQSIGDGLSGSDMPNTGSGSYAGNWAAAVQAADENGNGAVSLESGMASLSADFGKGKITATLTGLATLSGDISGNTFSGTKAASVSAMHDLDASADFEGSFSGGFYGVKAAEAGGIFDFASDDGEGGAFRGAFGAARTD